MKSIPELDKLFDLDPQTPPENYPAVVDEATKELTDQEEDYQLARATMRSLITKSEDTLDEMIALAKNSEHPRTYEVAGQLIKTVSDVAKDLMALQKQVKDLNKDEPNNVKNITNNNNNVVFAGSTTELFKMLKNNNNDDGRTIEQ